MTRLHYANIIMDARVLLGWLAGFSLTTDVYRTVIFLLRILSTESEG